jgi:hypothetical protein
MSAGGHSSKAMTMLEPRARWIDVAFSGEMKQLEPSMGDLKATPSSVIWRRSVREKTWKPPESVRIGPS